MAQFYMVVVDGQQGPAKRYEDYELARQEAERLMHKEGRPAHVLSNIATVTPRPGVWTMAPPQ